MKGQAFRRATVLVVCLAVASPVPSNGGVFAGMATEWTQLSNNLQLINSYIRQGEQLRQEIVMVLDMAKNTANLPFQIFGPIMSDINRLSGIVQSGRALAYSMANLDAEFRNRFRGYGYNARTWFRDYKDWSQTSLDTTLGTLRAAGMQGQQLASEQAVLDQLRVMAGSAEGRMKALQVSNQIMEQQVQQLMKLRQLILADLQSKQAYQAAQIQKQAAAEAGTEKFFNYGRRFGDRRGFEAAK